MNIKRNLTKTVVPENHPGFLGAGHTARPVVSGGFKATDPFIMLMDDIIDKKDTKPVGGPHPHAGFETVTLILEGELGDGQEQLKSGDLQLMTAGSGIEHAEIIDKPGYIRILQLWLDLPRKNRQATPRVQDIAADRVPTVEEQGVKIRVYSGQLAGTTSPVQNYTPLIIADIALEADTPYTLQIPANFNTFLYVLDGSVQVGEEQKQLQKDQVGWLDLYQEEKSSELLLKAGETGARLVLYGGKPTGDSIVSHGPFIADSTEDINRLYREYRQGKMIHIIDVPATQKIRW